MLESFIYSINAILPICLIMLLGKLLSLKMLNSEFFVQCDKFVFNICLPILLFNSIADATVSSGDRKLLVFSIVAMSLAIALPWIFTPIFIKDNAKRGAFIQGTYRSNVAILGLPIATILFGDEGAQKFAMVIAFAIIAFNIGSVILLTVFAPKENKKTPSALLRDTALGIIKNPLVIGSVLALPFMLTSLEMPGFASTTLDYIGRLATPLALLSIGASVRFSKGDGRLKLAIIASLIKTVIMPLTATLTAYAMNFRGTSLGVIFILFAVPSAVASYVMAKNMKSDYILSGQIIMITTVCCMATMFLGIFIMRYLNLI